MRLSTYMPNDTRYASRKFLLACAIVGLAAVALFSGRVSAEDFVHVALGIYTVFAGGDVALNAIHARAATAAQRAALSMPPVTGPAAPTKCAERICVAEAAPGSQFCAYHKSRREPEPKQ